MLRPVGDDLWEDDLWEDDLRGDDLWEMDSDAGRASGAHGAAGAGKCAGVPVRPEGRGSTGARDGRVYRSRAIKASRAARVSTSASWRAGTSYSSRASS